jgi:hypothetical protein
VSLPWPTPLASPHRHGATWWRRPNPVTVGCVPTRHEPYSRSSVRICVRVRVRVGVRACARFLCSHAHSTMCLWASLTRATVFPWQILVPAPQSLTLPGSLNLGGPTAGASSPGTSNSAPVDSVSPVQLPPRAALTPGSASKKLSKFGRCYVYLNVRLVGSRSSVSFQ